MYVQCHSGNAWQEPYTYRLQQCERMSDFNAWFKTVQASQPAAGSRIASGSSSVSTGGSGVSGGLSAMWSSLAGKSSPSTDASGNNDDVEAGTPTLSSYLPTMFSSGSTPVENDWTCGLSRYGRGALCDFPLTESWAISPKPAKL